MKLVCTILAMLTPHLPVYVILAVFFAADSHCCIIFAVIRAIDVHISTYNEHNIFTCARVFKYNVLACNVFQLVIRGKERREHFCAFALSLFFRHQAR